MYLESHFPKWHAFKLVLLIETGVTVESTGGEDQDFFYLIHTSYDLGRQAGNVLCFAWWVNNLKVMFNVYICLNNDSIATEKCENDPK